MKRFTCHKDDICRYKNRLKSVKYGAKVSYKWHTSTPAHVAHQHTSTQAHAAHQHTWHTSTPAHVAHQHTRHTSNTQAGQGRHTRGLLRASLAGQGHLQLPQHPTPEAVTHTHTLLYTRSLCNARSQRHY